MKVTCQSCQARYTIADEKVRGKVAKIRCKKCGTTILVDGTNGAGSSSSDGPVSTAPMAADAAALTAEVDMPASPEPLPAAKPVAPAPEPVALRRPGRAASTDLFGGARHEEAIATSAPATPSLPHVSEAGNEKLTGARNENSVLFSLSALTGSPSNGPPVPGPDTIPSSRTADLRSLIGTGPSPAAPSKDNKSKLDDIMNLGGGGLYSPALISPALAPPPLELSVSADDASRAPKSKGRWIGIAAAVVLIGGVATAFAMMKGGEQTAASTMGSASPSATMASRALTAAGTAEPAPAASGATAAAPTESATASAAVAAQPAPEATPTAIAPGQPPPPKPEAEREKKPVVAEHVAPKVEKVEKPAAVEKPAVAAPTPAPAPAPVTQAALTGSASGEFDRAAAMSILSNTATAAQGCKKPDGPTGSGKVAVTYANNGVATTATVEGPPFAGTAVGGCIAGRFRSTRIPPFAGSPVTVHKSFFIN